MLGWAMLYLRRTVAVLIGFVFLAVLLAALVVLRLNSTFLDPEFYPEQLEKHGVYRFIMVDVLESALDEARAIEAENFGIDIRENPLVATGLTTAQIIDAVHRSLSARDLQRIASPAALRAGQYVSAERDTVTLKVKTTEPIKGVADELNLLMRESGAYGQLLEREVKPRILEAAGEAVAEDGSGWMLYLFRTGDDGQESLVRAVMGILTPRWLESQVEQAVDPLTAYVVGESDGFRITMRFDDAQASAAFEATKSILREVDDYDLVYTGVVEPAVKDRLGEEVNLPYGLAVTNQEVVDALRQSAAPALVQQQAELLVDGVSTYVTGRSDRFSTEISLVSNKQAAARVITELVGTKISEALATLPGCATEARARDAVANLRRLAAPACVPQGVNAGDLLEYLSRATGSPIHFQVMRGVPDNIAFTEADLRAALREAGGPETLEAFDNHRGVFRKSWAYTHQDLRADLAARGNALEVLDRTRSILADGYVLSARGGRKDGPGGQVDMVRGWFKTIRQYGWAVYVAAPVLLVIIGLLGGTTWRARIAWASATMLLSATAVSILAWPVYDTAAGEVFAQARAYVAGTSEGPFTRTSLLVTDGLVGIVEAAADEFAEGIRLSSLILVAVAVAVLLGTIFWDRIAAASGDRRLRLFQRD